MYQCLRSGLSHYALYPLCFPGLLTRRDCTVTWTSVEVILPEIYHLQEWFDYTLVTLLSRGNDSVRFRYLKHLEPCHGINVSFIYCTGHVWIQFSLECSCLWNASSLRIVQGDKQNVFITCRCSYILSFSTWSEAVCIRSCLLCGTPDTAVN